MPRTPAELAPLVNEYLDRYVANVDAKLGVLFVVDTGVAGLLLAHLPDGAGGRAAAWLGVAALLGALLACLYAVFPRLPPKGAGFFYWEDVAHRASGAAYAEEVLALSELETQRVIAENCFHSARALRRKFWGLRLALPATLLGLVAAGTALALG